MLNYTDFLIETYDVHHTAKSKEVFLLACAEKGGASLEESESLQYFISEGLIDDLFETCLSLNEESFADKFKALAAAAQEKIKEKGKDYAKKLGDKSKAALKFGGKILTPLKGVLEKVKAILQKAWEYIKEMAKATVEKAKDAILPKIQHLLKNSDKKRDLVDEVKNLGSMAASMAKFVNTGFVGALASAGQKAATTEESLYIQAFESAFFYAAAETLNEGFTVEDILTECELFESDDHGTSKGGIHIPFISSIMSKLSHFPPFSVFHKIEAAVEKTAAKGLNKISILATKIADAPGPFEFPVVAGLFAIVIGHIAEEQLHHLLDLTEAGEKLLGFAIPGFGLAMKIMKYGGLGLALYGVIQHVIGGDKKDGDHKEHTEEKPKEENLKKKNNEKTN